MGQFKEGMRNGKGSFEWADKTKYEGNYFNDKKMDKVRRLGHMEQNIKDHGMME